MTSFPKLVHCISILWANTQHLTGWKRWVLVDGWIDGLHIVWFDSAGFQFITASSTNFVYWSQCIQLPSASVLCISPT